MTHTGHSEKVLFMRVLIIILVSIFTFQSLAKADDIRDLEIEGIALGHSLLDHFTKKEIDKFYLEKYPKKDFILLSVVSEKFQNYDAMQFNIKRNDKKYIIEGIAGIIIYEKDLKACYKKKDEIVNDISSAFKNFYKNDAGRLNNPVGADPYGGTYDIVTFRKNKSMSSERIQISCNDWSEQSGIVDSVKVEIYSEELVYFIDNVAYD